MIAAAANRSTNTAMGDIEATANAPMGKPIAYVSVTAEAVVHGMRGKSIATMVAETYPWRPTIIGDHKRSRFLITYLWGCCSLG
jgi:hypothetical protein